MSEVAFIPPSYMGEVASEEFLRAQKVLKVQGLLDAMDLSLLTDYANAFEEVQELTIMQRSRGEDYFQVTPSNGEVATGLYTLLNQRREALRKLRTDLGFTVRQRSGRRKVSDGTKGRISKDDI